MRIFAESQTTVGMVINIHEFGDTSKLEQHWKLQGKLDTDIDAHARPAPPAADVIHREARYTRAVHSWYPVSVTTSIQV